MFGFLSRTATPQIRALTARDAYACAQIHRPAFAHPWSGQDFEALLTAVTSLGDGAFIGHKLAGLCLARHVAGEAEILTIVVDESMRGKSLGKALMAHTLARLAAVGAQELFLEVESGNQAALRLYTAFGFVKVGERPAYTRMKDGTQALALIMRRALA